VHAVFFAFLAAAAAFVWWTSASLPEAVASHFGAGGAANGFMPRASFVAFTLALVVVVPALLHSLGWLSARIPVRFVNLPNRNYWLAPERRDATLAALGRFGGWLGYATLGLLCAVHWLVVRANAQQPPRLEQAPLVALVSIYLVALFVGMAAVLGRFFRVPR
jgi:uncharacterized membrane protein